jgi:hypothetical protein
LLLGPGSTDASQLLNIATSVAIDMDLEMWEWSIHGTNRDGVLKVESKLGVTLPRITREQFYSE